jgi:hypothetical protein
MQRHEWSSSGVWNDNDREIVLQNPLKFNRKLFSSLKDRGALGEDVDEVEWTLQRLAYSVLKLRHIIQTGCVGTALWFRRGLSFSGN